MSTNVFEELEAIETRLDYYDLAKRVADGEEVSATDIMESCRYADKTTQQFKGLVETIQNRAQRRAEYDKVPGIKAKQDELRQQIEAANAELEAAVEAHREKTRPLQYEISDLQQEYDSLWNIPAELVRDCPHEGLKERARALAIQENHARNAAFTASHALQAGESEIIIGRAGSAREQRAAEARSHLGSISNTREEVRKAMLNY